MLKKSASGVLGPLSCSRTAVYAPRAKAPAALLDLAPPNRLRVGERAFLNILISNGVPRFSCRINSFREFLSFQNPPKVDESAVREDLQYYHQSKRKL